MLDLKAIFDLDDGHEGNEPGADRNTACEVITCEDLPDRWRQYYEERAAIREYDGGQAREHAEAEAFTETLIEMRRDGQC